MVMVNLVALERGGHPVGEGLAIAPVLVGGLPVKGGVLHVVARDVGVANAAVVARWAG